jgi:hypothetical protein
MWSGNYLNLGALYIGEGKFLRGTIQGMFLEGNVMAYPQIVIPSPQAIFIHSENIM